MMGQIFNCSFGAIIAFCGIVVAGAMEKSSLCLTEMTGNSQRKSFHYKGGTLPIVIESSHKASHMLSSHILKILLEERLGYDSVDVRISNNANEVTHALDKLSGCYPAGCSGYEPPPVPSSMINLEVWTPPSFSFEPWIQRTHISYAGRLGPQGRYGWYVPTQAVEDNWENSGFIIDHWRSLQLKEVTSQFSMSGQEFSNNVKFVEEETHVSCQGIYCAKKGRNCRRSHNNCAVLLSSYTGLDKGVLSSQISQLGLDISIAWLGSNLTSYVNSRTARGANSLFLNWTPNTLTLDNYTRIALPYCRVNDNPSCDFENNFLSKMTWKGIESYLPQVYHVVSQMKFTPKQYEDLLKLFMNLNPKYDHANIDDYKRTACEWIMKNKHIWEPWFPEILSTKKKLYLGALFPLTGPYKRQPGVVPAAKLAQGKINRSQQILPDYELILLLRDTQCKTDIAMKEFMHLLVSESQPIPGIIGVGCSTVAESIAGVSKHFDKIVVSYSAEVSLQLSNRRTYPFFFRTIPPITQNAEVYMDFFQQYDWCQVALLAEDAEQFPEYHTFLHDYFSMNGVKVAYHRTLPHLVTDGEAQNYLSDIKAIGTKVIIVTSFEVSARTFLCATKKKKMTPRDGYVWFLPYWFTVDWWNTAFFNRRLGESVPCSNNDMLEAIQGHFTLSSAVLGDPTSQIVGNMTVSEWQATYLESLKMLAMHDYESSYASYTYDAVWVFALGLHKLLTENPSAYYTLASPHTRNQLMYHMDNTSFEGASGPVQFQGADRKGVIDVHQFQGNQSQFVLVGRYVPGQNDSVGLELNLDALIWESGSAPIDCVEDSKRPCGIEAFRRLLGVSCDLAIVVANLAAVVFFAIAIIVIVLSLKNRYEHKVKDTRKRIMELGLMDDSTILALDKWETPREQVMLNRKLGEGAFGTVYGGEAFLEEDSKWIAVAVKTLKSGSSTEDKLDFLSEAEMMKRFRHDNIVKLVGICTRGEPILTIMEFMLYGDLKTFLLARRHLVGQFYAQAQDVSPNMLTKYALDIAKGMKYLADNKYVHRDLACRNCLVHAEKTVKIADFGMARPIFDCDYYRFNRKGMLPVRWMAPESLNNGLFHSTSDVWAYGIVLYEIMTFGNIPYQGLSNNEVLKSVTEGNVMNLPSRCSVEMRNLLYSCWKFNPMERCTMEDIVSLLTGKPLFIQPVVADPNRALQIERSLMGESFDFADSKQLDKRRISLAKSSHHIKKLGAFDKRNPLFPFMSRNLKGKGSSGSVATAQSAEAMPLRYVSPHETKENESAPSRPINPLESNAGSVDTDIFTQETESSYGKLLNMPEVEQQQFDRRRTRSVSLDDLYPVS